METLDQHSGGCSTLKDLETKPSKIPFQYEENTRYDAHCLHAALKMTKQNASLFAYLRGLLTFSICSLYMSVLLKLSNTLCWYHSHIVKGLWPPNKQQTPIEYEATWCRTRLILYVESVFNTSNHGQNNLTFWKEESFFHGILWFLSHKLRLYANSSLQKPTLYS